jgi:hypothetical protein
MPQSFVLKIYISTRFLRINTYNYFTKLGLNTHKKQFQFH